MDERVSDQDRDQAAEELREHYAAGRLKDDELSERIQAVYDAQTSAELRRLTADLPMLPAVRERRERAALAERRAQLQRRVIQEAGGGLIGFLVCTGIWLATGAHGMFWPVWVALVVVVALLRNGWNLYGPAPRLDRVEEDLARRRHRHRRPSAERETGCYGSRDGHRPLRAAVAAPRGNPRAAQAACGLSLTQMA
jgi:hypothetical protein